ncbi:hypothetical protein IWX90DRAFT_27719 [Phyllosticta citrichinensis]|uniref:Uncharacterized protein n=1 Tax=Phyllosticta citrichinensis TaxID=1130410 RepID=A0ABR1Y737_9PEZI
MFSCLALLFVGSVLAGPASVPSQTSAFYDFTTAYPPEPTVLSNPTCAANCTWTAYGVHQYSWWKAQVVTETITRGVAYVIVNNLTNTTRTSTSYYELPSGHELPPTNSAGTQIHEVTVSQPIDGTWKTFATNITYPSIYTQYPSG